MASATKKAWLGALLGLALVTSAAAICPKKCACGKDELDVSCSFGNLSVIPIFLNPSVTHLNLSNNDLRAIEGGLNFYANLEALDLSGNMFRHVGKRQFASQGNLQTLNLSNNFLTTLHEHSFLGPAALQTLDLSRNGLEVLEDDAFAGLDSLVELLLSHNRIREISRGAFSGLRRLRVLHVEHNFIGALGADWMAPMGNLRFLYASNNGITGLPDDAFKALTALREVRLSHNRLSDVGQFAFRGSRAVDTLDLSFNLLETVPTVPLSQMPQLSRLDLSGNPIRSLDRSSFHMMFVLEMLRLDHMELLVSVAQHTFVDNVNMRDLSMEDNARLRPLPWGIFSTNTLLGKVSFRGNAWQTLSVHQLPRNSLRELSLVGLPLHCNCSLLWLWELYHREEGSGIALDEAVCATVEAAAKDSGAGGEDGDPLAVMSPDQLICTSRTSHVLIAVSIGVLVTVFLLVAVALIWYRVREWRRRRKFLDPGIVPTGALITIKDDTMVYKDALQLANGASPTGTSTYRANYAASYSPPPPPSVGPYVAEKRPLGSEEPFYEVPKYAEPDGAALGTATDDPKSSTESAGSSKYSSSTASGFLGSELWETEYYQHRRPLPQQTEQQQHGYVNFSPAMVPGRMFYPPTTPSLHGSPQSTSTTTTVTGGAGSSMSSGSSSSGSSSTGGGGGKYGHHTAVFYSPSRFNKYPGGHHSGTIHLAHPGLSPMMHHDFLSRSRQQQQQKQQHHFTTSGRGGGRANKRSGGGSASAVDLFV